MSVNYTLKDRQLGNTSMIVSGVFTECLSFSSFEVCLKAAYIMAANLSLNNLDVYAVQISCVLMVLTEVVNIVRTKCLDCQESFYISFHGTIMPNYVL